MLFAPSGSSPKGASCPSWWLLSPGPGSSYRQPSMLSLLRIRKGLVLRSSIRTHSHLRNLHWQWLVWTLLRRRIQRWVHSEWACRFVSQHQKHRSFGGYTHLKSGRVTLWAGLGGKEDIGESICLGTFSQDVNYSGARTYSSMSMFIGWSLLVPGPPGGNPAS